MTNLLKNFTKLSLTCGILMVYQTLKVRVEWL